MCIHTIILNNFILKKSDINFFQTDKSVKPLYFSIIPNIAPMEHSCVIIPIFRV